MSTHLVHIPVSTTKIKHWPYLYYEKDFTIGQDDKNIIMVLNVSHEAFNRKPGSCTKAQHSHLQYLYIRFPTAFKITTFLA